MSAIESVDLTHSFGGLRAVDDVSLSVETGELRSVIGPNGAGKTTLFNLLSGRFPPSGGRIFVVSVDVTGWPPHRVAAVGVARTFQITNVFPMLSARENVRVAAQARHRPRLDLLRSRTADRRSAEIADAVLEQVGLTEQAERQAATMAYGDQRLLEIAIALATEPRVLLLDEPMAGTSPAETERVAALIRSLAGPLTVLLIEHDMDVVLSISDRVTVMHQGRVLAEGTPAEVAAATSVQDAYLGVGR